MSKSTRGQKEYTRLQEIIHQNKKMKREIASLRRQLAKIDLDRHSFVKDIIDDHYADEEHEQETDKMLKSLKDTWKCNSCNEGHLEIKIYTKVNQTYYIRQCNNCAKKTKSQVYNPDKVKGIIHTPDK